VTYSISKENVEDDKATNHRRHMGSDNLVEKNLNIERVGMGHHENVEDDEATNNQWHVEGEYLT